MLARTILALEVESSDNFAELLRLTAARFQEGDVSESELIKVKLERIKFDSTIVVPECGPYGLKYSAFLRKVKKYTRTYSIELYGTEEV